MSLTIEAPKLEITKNESEYYLFRRWAARWLDGVIMVFFYPIFIFLSLLAGSVLVKDNPFFKNENPVFSFIINLVFWLYFLSPLLYFPLSIKFFGQTIGQKITSMQLVTNNDQRPGFWRVLGRVLSNLIPASEIASLIMVLVRDDRKSLYDLICGTKNVSYKKQNHVLAKTLISVIMVHLVVIGGFASLFYFSIFLPHSKLEIKPVEINQVSGYELFKLQPDIFHLRIEDNIIIINDNSEENQAAVSKMVIQKYGYGAYYLYSTKSNIREVLIGHRKTIDATESLGHVQYFTGDEAAILSDYSSKYIKIEIDPTTLPLK